MKPGKGSPAYGTGRSLSLPSGYVRVRRPGHPLAGKDGYVYEHRLVVYEAGIEVPPGHHVHHRNHDRQDNRLENLEVVTNGEHQLQHHMAPGMTVKNQYGEWPVLPADERRERSREWARGYYADVKAGRRVPKRRGPNRRLTGGLFTQPDAYRPTDVVETGELL